MRRITTEQVMAIAKKVSEKCKIGLNVQVPNIYKMTLSKAGVYESQEKFLYGTRTELYFQCSAILKALEFKEEAEKVEDETPLEYIESAVGVTKE